MPRQDAADVSRWRWDAYFATIFAVTLILVGIEGPAGQQSRLIIGGAYLAMALWYALVGRTALFSAAATPWQSVVYLAGMLALVVLAAALTATNTFILLAVCPQCFMVFTFRRAIVAVLVLNAAPALTEAATGQDSSAIAAAAGVAVLGFAFSLVYGGWTFKIITQNVERGELIEQLGATRAELARAERQAGVLAERNRLAGDIHDTITQDLASIVMLMQAAEAAVETDPAQARQHLAMAAEAARESLAGTRTLVTDLAPAQLASGTIGDALARLADQASAGLCDGARFKVSGEPRSLATGTEVMLLRVCQEALANVRKHAAARSAAVCLAYFDGEVRLEVRDDGSGFDPGGITGGYGLRGMRSRAADAGGLLTVHSAPGGGTSVTVAVPA